MGSTGKVKYADFKKFVENTYGKKPVVNDIQATVRATLSIMVIPMQVSLTQKTLS